MTFEILCDDCGALIAESDSIVDLQTKVGDASYNEVIDEWRCGDCQEKAAERSWEHYHSGDPARTDGDDPLHEYLTLKGEL